MSTFAFSPKNIKLISNNNDSDNNNLGPSQEVDEQELLEPLVHINTPYSVLKIVLWETLKGLKIRPQLRKSFVTSGSLQRLQSLLTVTDVPLEIIELLKEINAQFPQDVVTYYQKVR